MWNWESQFKTLTIRKIGNVDLFLLRIGFVWKSLEQSRSFIHAKQYRPVQSQLKTGRVWRVAQFTVIVTKGFLYYLNCLLSNNWSLSPLKKSIAWWTSTELVSKSWMRAWKKGFSHPQALTLAFQLCFQLDWTLSRVMQRWEEEQSQSFTALLHLSRWTNHCAQLLWLSQWNSQSP